MTITVTQTGVTVQTLTLGPGTGSIPRGSSVQFTAQALDSAQQPIPDAVYTYISSNPGVLNVDSRGQGRALGEGTATITVKSGSKTTTASLTVTASSTALSGALWKAVEPVRPLQLRDLGQDADGTFWGFGTRLNEARLFRSADGKNWAPVYMNNTSAPACNALYSTSAKVTLAAFSKDNLWLTCNDTLYQSVNGGLYWMERLTDSSLDGERVKLNLANPNLMVIGGIYSSDAGKTWKKRSYGNDLTISGAYSKTIFAATEKSLDQGVTWQPYGKPFASPAAFSVQGEAITPAGQLMQVVGADIAGVWTTGLYVSGDLGATWTKKSSLSIPKYAKVLFTFYKPQPTVMYVQWPDGLAISQDSGATFKVVSSKYAFPDEGDSSVIYRPLPVSQVGNTYNTIEGLSRSLDGGITWTDIVNPIYPSGNNYPLRNVRVLRDKDGRVLVATGSGLWAAPGAKDTFSSAGNNLGLTIQPSQAGVIDRTQASRLFAITSDEYYGRGKPYLTETTGSQWLKLDTASLQSLTQNGVTATIWHGATSMGDVLTSTDSGLSWSWTGRVPFNQDGQGAASLVLRASRQNTARLYALSPAGVHRSENSGQTWQWASVNLQHASGTDLSVDPLNDQTVYLATNHAGIYKTTNSGQDWKAVNNGLSNLEVRCLAISPDGSSLLAGTNDGGVYRSLDRGGTWEFVSSLLQSYAVTDVEFDPSDANVAYATTTGGVYKTVDKGSSWVMASKGLTSPYITWVQVSSDGKTLYLGTNDQEVFTGSPSSNTGADFRTQSIQRTMN
ncbi:hypothetical protein [Deinococcus seoulensis]|nr:hypothetical protein [Deinococcus seoulensis]